MSSFTPGATLGRLSWGKIKSRVLPGLRHVHHSRLRTCGCCGRLTAVLSLDDQGEISRCLRCGANFRYEVLAAYLRSSTPNIGQLDVVELDPDSPLKAILCQGRTSLRTYYSSTDRKGSVRADGARCEDVTALTLPDASVDLLVSSEVLEHVPDLKSAAREISRVLRPRGTPYFHSAHRRSGTHASTGGLGEWIGPASDHS